ncbi:MAG TPA: endonuclease/exonuclease/phosphatase family protein [Longimicrobiales bacterium]
MVHKESGFVVLEGHGDAAHPELAHWHGNIGEPVALDQGREVPEHTRVIDVLSWNVAIGLGRLEQVVQQLKAGVFDGESRAHDRPLVILVQEAYRSDETVPSELKSPHHGGKSPRNQRFDIVEAARALDMSLRYAPSMRNGRHRSDRGNAVLASTAIGHARAFPLPHVRQLRVAVAVELAGLPWLTFVSAHLDTRGRVRSTPMTGRYASGRAAQARGLAQRLANDLGEVQHVLIGADLNTYLGTREPLLRELHGAGFDRKPHVPPRSHTFHAPPVRMLLDHIFVRAVGAGITDVHVRRLDEHVLDRGPNVFGSDHHPLLARLEIVDVDRRRARR